jgi:DNA-binding transcriptional MerR regulator
VASVYKIGVVSRRTGLSAATLRTWEDQYGLLAPLRTPGGTRLYSEDDIERAGYIRALVRERGYSLNAVANSLDGAADATVSEKEVHGVLRRLVRAGIGWQAVATFVEGVKVLTGSAVAALGLYLPSPQSICFVVTVGAGRLRRLGGKPIPATDFPVAWQQAIDAHQPCFHQDLQQLKLPAALGRWVRETKTRSFHAEPLTVGWRLVGVLMIGSPTVAGISGGGREICARLAIPAGPVLSTFASQF